MIRLFIAIALLTGIETGAAWAQLPKTGNLTITAQIKGLPGGKWVYYGPAVRDATMDSVVSSPGGFAIRTNIARGDGNIYLFRIGKENVPNTAFTMFVDRGEVHITGEGPYFESMRLSGSAFVMDDNLYKAALKDNTMLDKTKGIEQKAIEAYRQHDQATLNDLKPQLEARQVEVFKVTKNWIAAHPSSEYSTVLIATSLARMQPMSETITAFGKLTQEAKDNAIGRQLAATVKKQLLVSVGKQAPNFMQPDSSGKEISLKGFRGRYVLVDFWASWCSPCRAENPNVVKAYNKYKSRNFTILGVSLDKTRESWLRAIQKDSLNWTQVSDLKFWENTVATKYGVTAIPANFLIDPQGNIIARDLRDDELENKLKEILGT